METQSISERLTSLLGNAHKAERRSNRSMKAQRRNPNTSTTRRAIDDYNAYAAALNAYNDAMDAYRALDFGTGINPGLF